MILAELPLLGNVSGMDWQQAIALIIVTGTAGLFFRARMQRGKVTMFI